jgi:peptide/nickel transport system permease protein
MVPLTDRPSTRFLRRLIRRLAEGLATAWAAVSFTFFVLRLAAGDPLAALLSQGLATPAQAEVLRRSLGYDLPIYQQYLRFLGGLLHGDMGLSILTSRPVSAVIAQQFPATASLAVTGLLIGLALGFGMGVVWAWTRFSTLRAGSRIGASLSLSLPVAVTGLLILWAFQPFVQEFPAISQPSRLALPALALGIASSGAIARAVRTSLQATLGAPFILSARSHGLPRGPRLLWHALRPALPPVVSLSALEAAFLFAGTVVTETVFSRPGLGRLLVDAILKGDFPVAQGIVVLAAAIYTASQIAADVVSLALDPRLREGA